MTANCQSEKPVSDAERRHGKVREWLIDAVSVGLAALAVSHYKPDGTLAEIIVFAGGYAVARFLTVMLSALSGVLFCALSLMIYLYTVALSLSSLPAMPLALFLPVIAQGYWIWALWLETGSLFHPLTLASAAWLILLGISMLEGNLFPTSVH
jgi:hypothetical protein